MNRVLNAGCALVLAATLAGCGGDEVVRPTVSVSVGKQLMDLKKARDSGALSQREYDSQKAMLIKNVE